MSSMPPAARLYWWIVAFAGVLAAVVSQTYPFPTRPHQPWEIVAFILAAVVLGGQKLSLDKLRKDEEAMSMTLGFAITFATLIRLGPSHAVPISVLCCLSSCLYPRRQKLHQLAFNVFLSAAEAFVTSVLFVAINGWTLDFDPTRTAAAVAGSCAGLFLVNTFGVAIMISIYTRERLLLIWKEHFAWTVPGYLASACVGALAMFWFHQDSGAIFLLLLPIAFVIYKFIWTHLQIVEDHKRHIADLEGKQAELERLYLNTIESLALAVDAKDQYTHQHIVRVQRYAVAIAEAMGLDGHDLQGVRTGALLHDIGKLGVPENVLLKPGALTAEEYEQIKLHPTIGAAILQPVEFPWPVLPAVRHHHERWDGTGYPDGLSGETIPLIARIMAVADVYDALTSNRSYRGAWSHEKAFDFIRGAAGKDFDPVVVDAFLDVIDRVVREMAAEGVGPLVAGPPTPTVRTATTAVAGVAISVSPTSTSEHTRSPETIPAKAKVAAGAGSPLKREAKEEILQLGSSERRWSWDVYVTEKEYGPQL